MLAEFRDYPNLYTDANPENYAGTSSITRTSGKKKIVIAGLVHNERLIHAS